METHRWGRHPDMLGRVCDWDQLPGKSKAQTKPIPWVGISPVKGVRSRGNRMLQGQRWEKHGISKNREKRGASRWQKSKTQRSPSSPQIHQKYIYRWNNSYRTPTERWQKTSHLPKGKKFPRTWVGQKKKLKTETKE